MENTGPCRLLSMRVGGVETLPNVVSVVNFLFRNRNSHPKGWIIGHAYKKYAIVQRKNQVTPSCREVHWLTGNNEPTELLNS